MEVVRNTYTIYDVKENHLIRTLNDIKEAEKYLEDCRNSNYIIVDTDELLSNWKDLN